MCLAISQMMCILLVSSSLPQQKVITNIFVHVSFPLWGCRSNGGITRSNDTFLIVAKLNYFTVQKVKPLTLLAQLP